MSAVRARLTGAAARLGAVNEAVVATARNLAGLLLAAMMVIVTAQVASRYLFGAPLSWTEELAKALMVWTAFLVAPWAYRHGANVAINVFADVLPDTVRRLTRLAITVAIVWIVWVLLGESFDFVARGMGSRAASLPVLAGVFYLVTPVAFAALLSCALEQLLLDVAALLPGRDRGEDLG